MLKQYIVTFEINWCAEHEVDIMVEAHTEKKARKKAYERAEKLFNTDMIVFERIREVEKEE